MSDGFLVGLSRSSLQCVHCKSSVKDSVVCWCQKEIKNVMQTYIRSYTILESGDGLGQWTLKQLCHKRIYCPRNIQCMQVKN